MSILRSRFLKAAPIAALLFFTGFASEARASLVTVNSVGQTFAINWTLDLGGGNILMADATFLVTALTSNSVSFSVSLANNTLGGSNSAIHSLGFDTAPNATSAVVSGGSFFKFAGVQQTFPGFQTIDVCVWTANNCSGGPQGKNMLPGSSDIFTLTLGGSWGGSPTLDLSRFVMKFQGDLGSYEFEGYQGYQVPEPSSLLLLSSGLLAVVVGGARYRRRK